MSKNKVRVAIIGVGNCVSSLVQGVEFYKNTPDNASVPGLIQVNPGSYHIPDIEFTLGIDINVTKVGKDIAEAIFAEPNNTYKFNEVLNGNNLRGSPAQLEVKLEVWDSPNSAGVVINPLRCTKLALDCGLSGPILGPSSCFFKTPLT
jgi:myo-inositol-1-phosphate synthase